jgi:hypothetical protein
MILLLISTLFIETSIAADPKVMLTPETLSWVVKEHLRQKNVKTDHVKIEYPANFLAMAFNAINKYIDNRILRSARFISNNQKFTCLVEAEFFSGSTVKKIEVSILSCSPAELPNGAVLSNHFGFTPFNRAMSSTHHDLDKIINENQIKPDPVGKTNAPREKKSVLRAE